MAAHLDSIGDALNAVLKLRSNVCQVDSEAMLFGALSLFKGDVLGEGAWMCPSMKAL